MKKNSRHICCCCGRKRKEMYLYQNLKYIRPIIGWSSNWRSYPRANSYKCKVKCLPYAGEVHLPAAIKKNKK